MTDPAGHLILEVHTTGNADPGPMQYITQGMLDYYRRVEAEWRELKARDANSSLVGSAGFEPATPTV